MLDCVPHRRPLQASALAAAQAWLSTAAMLAKLQRTRDAAAVGKVEHGEGAAQRRQLRQTQPAAAEEAEQGGLDGQGEAQGSRSPRATQPERGAASSRVRRAAGGLQRQVGLAGALT
jgi:hypothetical protein